jgi:hypothetical protein
MSANGRPIKYAEQLSDALFDACAMIASPVALVSKSEEPFLLYLDGTAKVIQDPWRVHSVFAVEFAHVFYGKNTFELRDHASSKGCNTHRWLELMQTRDYMR